MSRRRNPRLPRRTDARAATERAPATIAELVTGRRSVIGVARGRDRWTWTHDRDGDTCRVRYAREDCDAECEACRAGTCWQKVVHYPGCPKILVHDCGNELS